MSMIEVVLLKKVCCVKQDVRAVRGMGKGLSVRLIGV